MKRLRYTLESESKYNEINEKEYKKRQVLDLYLKSKIYGKDKRTGSSLLIKEQQIVLKSYLECLLGNF